MNKMPILGKTTTELAKTVADIVDKDNSYWLVTDYLKNVKRVKEHLTDTGELAERWYASIENGSPDYSIYSDPLYVEEAFACYYIYAREYIKRVASVADRLPKFNNIYDLGCGLGLSTALIKAYFPSQSVCGTQLEGLQKKVALELGRIYDFSVFEKAEITPGCMIFALDYMEHFQDPISHIQTILSREPAILVFANSFSGKSPGHFNQYNICGEVIEGKKTGKKFNAYLRSWGFEKLETNFYNGRPNIWIRK
jgi:hypothetical protein